MRENWVLVDFAGASLPGWLSRATSLKMMSAAWLAVIVLVVMLTQGPSA